MPRTYKPIGKKIYKKYDQELIEEALQEYNKTHQSLAEIATKYQITKSVLHRHKTFIMKKQGGQTALKPEEENYLIKYINLCSEWGYPLETIDIRFLIKGYLDGLGRNINKFNDNMPGPDYINAFLKRHTDKITIRLSQNLKRLRATVSSEIIEDYIEELDRSLRGVSQKNIVVYDETNLMDDPARKEALIKRCVKYPERIMNHTKGSTSIMFAAAADGSLLPPYVVYKAQNVYDTWMLNGPKGCCYNCTTSGWFNTITFKDWMTSIIFPYFKDKIGTKILIGDYLSSHLSIDLIRECNKYDIRFVFIPPNSTHLTQPLDVAVFSDLKSKWRKILCKWRETNGRTQTTIPKIFFPSMLRNLLSKIENNITENILEGFEKCGINPINKNKVLERLLSHNITENQCLKGVNKYKKNVENIMMSEDSDETNMEDTSGDEDSAKEIYIIIKD
ncbi:uncharacterized protein LOC126776829 [Nymphalis io]|uniref:uncharacterized protein LOC126776829 n=1 Tax=Inachis io TaxID=171585 RepID=UPI00216A4345|nr:uncharacterized protein LOC126776829 [Nymphalis io]XP_050355617.1 uncharacterized protein LOC126776829 [Nymphalis io]